MLTLHLNHVEQGLFGFGIAMAVRGVIAVAIDYWSLFKHKHKGRR